MGKKSKQGIKPQVYTCEEFNQVDAFDRNMVTIKQLFEGQGSQISKINIKGMKMIWLMGTS